MRAIHIESLAGRRRKPGTRADDHSTPGLGRLLRLVAPVLLLVFSRSMALGDEFSRTVHDSVRLFSYGTLILETRTGDIRIEGWDDPRVEIEAEKVVRAKSEKKAERLYDQVKIQVEGRDREVRVRTIYPSRRLWRPFRGESKLSVDFRIKMPYDANLLLKCVNGDVQVHGITGNQELRVNYGDVEVNIPRVDRLHSVRARSWLGYVESDLNGEGSAGFRQGVVFWNPQGRQDIFVRVRLGGVYIYSNRY